jgi:spermidine synthase
MPRITSRAELAFPVAIFLSAFLLFQVQPLICKYILPWFGGSPTVWTVCMLFFQVGLFFGYVYAHLTTRLVPPRSQAVLHAVLLLAALLVLPITPGGGWKPTGTDDPTWRIMALLTVCIGLPYFLLSSTGPLLQAWFSRVFAGRSPYRLYALSNLGSLIALVSYPFVVDPKFGAARQTVLWSWLFAAFVLCCTYTAWHVFRHAATIPRAGQGNGGSEDGDALPPSRGDRLLWFFLPMVPSVMLLATTNQVCTDVAVIPFLWVLPLTLYLLSFILCFHSPRWYPRSFWAIVWVVLLLVMVPVLIQGRGVVTSVRVPVQITVYFSLLFGCAMVCHGELVRLKPDPSHLTSFYLTLAAGGAAGGIFVGLAAPLIFPTYVELPLAMIACSALLLVVFFRDRTWILFGGRPRWAWLGLLVAFFLLAGLQVDLFVKSLGGIQEIHRNFYGVLQVKLKAVDPDQDEYLCRLIHGRTLHGQQFTRADKQHLPTTYYGEASGAGLILRNHRAGDSQRVGIVGLGVGTLAVYGNEGDTFRFYEINPAVVDLANRFFQYLALCRADVAVVPGDGRISLENEPAQAFDVLVLDAFSSDAIPIHLMTHEAFEIYLRHLKPDGVLAVHISNVHLDLHPVVAAHAEQFHLAIATVRSSGSDELGTTEAIWTLLSRDPASLQFDALGKARLIKETRRVYWTDDRNSLFEVLGMPGLRISANLHPTAGQGRGVGVRPVGKQPESARSSGQAVSRSTAGKERRIR